MINIVGEFFGTSGYANHTRQLANALSKITEVRVSCGLPPNWQAEVSDRELEMLKRQPKEDEINLIIAMPHQWRLFTKNGRNWAYCVWEGDKVPESFIDDFLNEDIEYIFVPSEHTYKAVFNSFKDDHSYRIREKVKILPHGVDLNLFYPKEKPKTFTFLCNKGFRNMEDRGGIQYFLKAYLEEFTKDDNVEALIKINPAYPIANLDVVLKELGATENSPKLIFNAQPLPYNKLVDLYNKGTVFVSPSRSDAFNIPCLEAMSCGVPVITTDFGGQTDFVNKENGWIVSGKIEEIKRPVDDYIYEGIKWLTPDISQLRKALREAYNTDLTTKRELSLQTAREFTWDKTAKEVLSLI